MAMGRSREVTIRRSGDAPLRLVDYGLIAQASSRTDQWPRQTRWHEIEVWSDDQAVSGPEQPHCVVVRYHTQWQDEDDHYAAWIVPRRGIADALRGYDPLERVLGHPPGERYDQKRRRLRASMLAGWEEAVADVLEIVRAWEDPREEGA